MTNQKQQIKTLRKEVFKTFLLIFAPHTLVCLLTTQTATNISVFMDWHISWFSIYFSISFLLYIFAPKIIEVRNKKQKQ
jgi:hypothetical protein